MTEKDYEEIRKKVKKMNKQELQELAEKNAWNAKASTAVATSSTNGLLSKEDKQKIDRISNNFDIVYDSSTETINFRFR